MKLTKYNNRIIIDSVRTKPENWTDQDEMIYQSYQILMMAIGKENNLDSSSSKVKLSVLISTASLAFFNGECSLVVS